MMKKALLCIMTCLLTCMYLNAQEPDYGLHIQSYPLPISKYTSMALDDGKPISIKGKDFTLKFDMLTRNENVFGTILRIITDDGDNIDMMYSVGTNDKRFPILVTGDVVHPVHEEARCEQWLPISITLSPCDGDVSITYDSTRINVTHKALIGTKSIRIAFGYCPFDGYSLADVASINIRDVQLFRGKQEIRHWKMGQHNQNVCYDELAYSPATGNNTLWIIDDYITWKKIFSKEFHAYPSIAFDPNVGTFYIANDKQDLYVLHAHDRSIDTIQVKGGEYVANFPNQLIYIPQQRQLLSYNLDEDLFSAFNPTTQQWEGRQAPVKEHDYWNNTLVYNPADSSLISFGGYGHYHYNNELLISYPYSHKAQYRTSLNDIHPRYSSSSVIVDSTLYIFGGRGCPSGRQELSPRNYYDLYSVNLLTRQVNKLWESVTTPAGGDFHPGDNMIYDKENECFYLFCSQKGGILMKIGLKEPEFEAMSLPIGAKVDSQFMYNNLYYSPQQKKLYASVHMAGVNGDATIEIYELDFPPIAASTFLQPSISSSHGEYRLLTSWWFYLIIVVVLLTGGWGVYRFINIRRMRRILPIRLMPKSGEPKELKLEMVSPHSTPTRTLHNYDLTKGCVCFFGGLRVYSKNGEDLTPMFTPVLKHLLILLILYTGKDPKGIIGHKLLSILWPDKSGKSAQNNRNVYISKLRSLLENVGDIKIINQNSFWSIHFENGAICDYLEALRLFNDITDNKNLEKIVELLLRGAMLPNVETDWIDAFKTDFSNMTIDLLSQLLKQDELPVTLKLEIADTLFQHDFINEDALQAKCSILCKQGKKGLAKIVYENFCKEYHNLLGIDYPYSMKQVISKKHENSNSNKNEENN